MFLVVVENSFLSSFLFILPFLLHFILPFFLSFFFIFPCSLHPLLVAFILLTLSSPSLFSFSSSNSLLCLPSSFSFHLSPFFYPFFVFMMSKQLNDISYSSLIIATPKDFVRENVLLHSQSLE